MRWPKYWSFCFSIIPSIEIPGLISFRMDWLDLLRVQGTLKSSPTPQFKSINSSAVYRNLRNLCALMLHQIANIRWIIEKAREFQKNIYFCFIEYVKAFDCVDYNKLWKILKEMGIPHHLTCLLRNLNAGMEATIRTGHGTTDWFQIRKGVRQGCIFSLCLFNLYAEYVV